MLYRQSLQIRNAWEKHSHASNYLFIASGNTMGYIKYFLLLTIFFFLVIFKCVPFQRREGGQNA